MTNKERKNGEKRVQIYKNDEAKMKERMY